MASAKNDALRERTLEGTLNYYDEQRCVGTANDKAIAARLGGHNWNIISNGESDEIYLRQLRNNDHYVDKNNRTTNKFMQRKRQFPRDPREPVKNSMTMLDDHPKVADKECRRLESHLAQLENHQSFGDFQRRRHELRPGGSPRPNRRNLTDIEEKLNATRVRGKDSYLRKIYSGTQQEGQGEGGIAISARSDASTRSSSSTARVRYPDWRQLQNESAAFSKCKTANTYSQSLHTSESGVDLLAQQIYRSKQRIPNYDFSVIRKNNNYSSEDKLLRSDSYYRKPRLAVTNNSVKYDMITNQVLPFKYS
ncbi:unnamed protein product [Amoebophrya sp. A25]|nr:unnamed protein product [Amoebophrya sp. A25]|eukprot:GSA25T00007367001.1